MNDKKESFFELLKKKRESQNIEIADISEFTKINPRYIEAIENGDFTVLPTVYMRLFLKAYAKFINSDPKQALEDYELFTTGAVLDNSNLNTKPDINPTYSQASTNLENQNISQIPPQKIATILIASLGILLVLYWASKITGEQNVELKKPKTSNQIPSRVITNLDSINSNDLRDEFSSNKPLINSDNLKKKINKSKQLNIEALPNIAKKEKNKIDENDFSIENRFEVLTRIIKTDKPYNISIKALQRTWLNISKSNEDSSNVLINGFINDKQELDFPFESTIKFEFLNNSHIQLKLNNISIDKYLSRQSSSLIRGSYESQSSQLYIGFYKPN